MQAINPEPWSQAENQAFIEMAQEGRCAAEIAELLERPITGIYWKAQYFSIPLKRASGDRLKGNALSDKDVSQIRCLYDMGWKPKQIQQEFNQVCVSYIREICRGVRR